MIVKVKNLVGKVIDLGVEPTDKVIHLKELVQQKEGIPPSQQRLIFAAKSLEDDKTLQECNVTPGATLHLVLALRG